MFSQVFLMVDNLGQFLLEDQVIHLEAKTS